MRRWKTIHTHVTLGSVIDVVMPVYSKMSSSWSLISWKYTHIVLHTPLVMSEWRKVLQWTGSQWTPTAFSKKKLKKPEAFHYSKVRALKQHFKCYPAVQDHEKPLISCKWTARSMGLNVNECFFCVAAEVEAGRERERRRKRGRKEENSQGFFNCYLKLCKSLR